MAKPAGQIREHARAPVVALAGGG
ncbi:MAG: hypothetical protein C4345_09815, partial [Chloroflexota bacterium]